MTDQRYNLIEKLEAGGMAEVFLGEATSVQGFKKKVAIKRVLPHLASHTNFIGMFLDEARLGALSAADVDYAVNVRYCDAEGRRPARDWPPPGPPFRPWDDFYKGQRRVVFGHWARRGLVVRPQCVGLDTGCVYGGKLSAWIAEEDRVVQVDGWRPAGTRR